MNYAQDVVSFLSVLTLVGQVIAVLILLLLMRGSRLFSWIATHGLPLMLLVAGIGTAGSLYFSDIALWTPCKLCWLQRIFLYPQVPILIVALWKRDRRIAPYIFVLCMIGIVIAAGHYAEQVSAAMRPSDPLVPCDTSGTSCASTPFFHFGYITIPMMAFTAFALNALGSIAILRTQRNPS